MIQADLEDKLSAKLAHLSAFLSVTYGEGRESFLMYSDEIQDNYLWGCAELARECETLADQINRSSMASTKEHLSSKDHAPPGLTGRSAGNLHRLGGATIEEPHGKGSA